mgnify:CR=1 FL=1
MNKVLEEFSKIGIIPVIALDHVEDAAPLAKALCCLLYTSDAADD